MLLGRDAEVIRRLGARAGALDRVSALAAAARATRVEADHEPVVVLLDLHVAVALLPAEVAAHRLDRQVEVAEERLVIRTLTDVERLVSLLEVGLEHHREGLLDRALAKASCDEGEHAGLEVGTAVV